MLLWVEFTSDKTEVSATSLFAYRLLCADKRARNSKAVDFSPLAQMRFFVQCQKAIASKVQRAGGSPARARLTRATKQKKEWVR